jgi:hypothetical protein
VPGVASALLVSAVPGEEMSCLAHDQDLRVGADPPESRGVVSFYALQALASSETTEDWSRRTTELCRADVDAGRLPANFAFTTTSVHGDRGTLPGAPWKR